jgi:hypothetical protein
MSEQGPGRVACTGNGVQRGFRFSNSEGEGFFLRLCE